MRNPNGYGSVVRMGGNRRRPYWVRKTTGFNEKGHPIYLTIGYTATREEGNILLAEYNKNPWDVDGAVITLKELYEKWLDLKAHKLSKSNQGNLKAAYNHVKSLEDMKYRNIKSYQMQETIDKCGKGSSTQAAIKNLWNHLDKFALELDVINKMYSPLLTRESTPETTRDRFSDEEIVKIWSVYNDYKEGRTVEYSNVDMIDTVLILLYTGFRISEFLSLKTADVNLFEGTFKGGIKTKAGKNRIVPIHSEIMPLVKERYNASNTFLISSKDGAEIKYNEYKGMWDKLMSDMGINKQIHECRHTFESVLDSNGANRRCIDLIMGHKSQDTGNRVYNHKTLNELREAIELFRVY